MEMSSKDRIERLIDNIEQVIFGKREVVELCVTGLLARGHILIEDIPGIGKTTLAQGLARSIDCSFHRIQFTSDMLPADILGVSILSPKTGDFEFRRGPIFASIILADEINRTPPKTQSALMEVMSEYRVSMDGGVYAVPQPFMVLATQNPIEYEGTYTLPESELDRFMMRIEIGYPPEGAELRIMRRRNPLKALENLKPALSAEDVLALQDESQRVKVDESVAQYIMDIVQGTREHDYVQLGASPRGSVELYAASQAHALIQGRDYVTPGDVKAMAVSVLAHRLIVKSRGRDLVAAAHERARTIENIVERVAVPK